MRLFIFLMLCLLLTSCVTDYSYTAQLDSETDVIVSVVKKDYPTAQMMVLELTKQYSSRHSYDYACIIETALDARRYYQLNGYYMSACEFHDYVWNTLDKKYRPSPTVFRNNK